MSCVDQEQRMPSASHRQTAVLHIMILCARAQAYQQLSFKLNRLFKECFAMFTFPDLQKKLTKFEPATQNPAAALLLKRGRKCVCCYRMLLHLFVSACQLGVLSFCPRHVFKRRTCRSVGACWSDDVLPSLHPDALTLPRSVCSESSSPGCPLCQCGYPHVAEFRLLPWYKLLLPPPRLCANLIMVWPSEKIGHFWHVCVHTCTGWWSRRWTAAS